MARSTRTVQLARVVTPAQLSRESAASSAPGGGAGAAELTVNDFTLTNTSIPENSVTNLPIGDFVSDPVGAVYTLVDDAGGRFKLSGATLTTGAVAGNYEVAPTADVQIKAVSGFHELTKTFTISYTNVAEVTDISLSAATIPENTAAGVTVGALTSTPAGATFALAPGNTAGTLFAISGNNLVTGATATNFENATTHTVTVRATRGSETFDKPFVITVTNVTEISDISLSAATIPENTAAGVTVGALTSTPTGATFALAPSNTAGTLFAVSGTNLVTGATATNFETAATHTVTIRGTRGGETFDKPFVITVTNVAEITNITLTPATMVEKSVQGTVVGTLASTPAGATFALAPSNTAGTRFQVVGNAVQAGATPTDFAVAQTHDVTIRGTRQSETFDKTITITITDDGL